MTEINVNEIIINLKLFLYLAEEDDGPSVAVLKGKIFYDQYRAMLLDKCP